MKPTDYRSMSGIIKDGLPYDASVNYIDGIRNWPLHLIAIIYKYMPPLRKIIHKLFDSK